MRKSLHVALAAAFSSLRACTQPAAAASAPQPQAASRMAELYRKDGVRITHDPYAPGMAEKYGTPGKTDDEGFDPYADTVGAGIYGGVVQRGPGGEVVIGRQYQNHNTRPGPVYAGGGYTPINNALRKGKAALKPLLDKYPDLVNDVSTGGARPLHMCGMGRENQMATEYLIMRGADIEALDTYGMTPLHRMASNNLEVGARELLEAGADPENRGKCGVTPAEMARNSRGQGVLKVLQDFSQRKGTQRRRGTAKVQGAGLSDVNGLYAARDPRIVPLGFSLTCAENAWDSEKMWLQLSDQATPWYEAENGSYIYWNRGDGKWWIDGPDGKGVYIVKAPNDVVPSSGWQALPGAPSPLPTVEVASNNASGEL